MTPYTTPRSPRRTLSDVLSIYRPLIQSFMKLFENLGTFIRDPYLTIKVPMLSL